MKILEVLAGAAIGLVSLVILGVGTIFAFGSMGRYIHNKNM